MCCPLVLIRWRNVAQFVHVFFPFRQFFFMLIFVLCLYFAIRWIQIGIRDEQCEKEECMENSMRLNDLKA